MFRRRIVVLTALVVAACDIPTELPMWEQTWMVEGEDIVVGVADVLPAGVTVSPAGTEFRAQLPGTDISLTVGEMCSACVPLNGTTAEKPAFTYTFATTSSLPAEIVTARLIGEQFPLRLAHDLSFDPLRPSTAAGAERGYLVVEISSEGALVGRDSISGDDVAFTAGTVLQPIITVAPVDVTNTLDVRVRIHSPAGDSTVIDTSDTLGIRVLPATAEFSEATVEAGAITVDAPAAELDLAVDSTLAARVQRGAVRLDITNPFGIEGDLALDFDMGASTIRKTLTLTGGTSTVEIPFTGAELEELLAAGSVAVSARGTLAAPGGTITVLPTDALVMESMLQLVVLVGGNEE